MSNAKEVCESNTKSAINAINVIDAVHVREHITVVNFDASIIGSVNYYCIRFAISNANHLCPMTEGSFFLCDNSSYHRFNGRTSHAKRTIINSFRVSDEMSRLLLNSVSSLKHRKSSKALVDECF